MAKWLARAETDLPDLLGQTGRKNRGEVSKAISVNLFNTFRTMSGGTLPCSKALRSTYRRFLEFAKALATWSESIGYPAALNARARLADLVRATLGPLGIKSQMARFKSPSSKKKYHPKLNLVISRIKRFMTPTGFRQPNGSIASSLIARC